MRILKFSEYKTPINSILETDGFGTSDFVLKKDDNICNYLFSIDLEDVGTKCFRLFVGKYSNYITIDGPKNSYCVLTLNEISKETMEDIIIDKIKMSDPNKEIVSVKNTELSRIFKIVGSCISNYLEDNPKTFRIYDEIQDNVKYNGDGTYMEYMKSILLNAIGSDWNAQEGNNKNSIILNR